MSARLLKVEEATCGYRGKAIVHGISLGLDGGRVLCVLGPNGSGKTTFFKTMLGLLSLQSGRIILSGRDIADYSLKELACHVAYVPQSQSPAFPFTVLDVVTMGRCSHLGAFSAPGPKDFRKAEDCMERLGVSHLASSPYTEISGGERQMVLIARALAQDPVMLVMDEPTSNLDFGNQIRLLNAINSLAASGIGVIMTTHFPDHSFLAGDDVAVMKAGRIVAAGPPDDILTESLLRSVYGVEVRVLETRSESGARIKTCVPLLEETR
jgi:iron complex transport system ATP-binding protein